MIKDKFVGQYIGNLKAEISKLKDALADGNHQDLYTVGRLQGEINGLRKALDLLEADLEDLDI